MRPERRFGSEKAQNRALLIEAAERVLLKEGYAAITASRVAAEAGIKVQLVYYYFKTMDDLLLELVKSNAEKRMKAFVRALAAPDPIKAIWDLNMDPQNAVMTTELLAMANHREALRSEIMNPARQFRSLLIEAVDRLLADRGIDRQKFPAGAIVTLLISLSRTMSQDEALNNSEGFAEAVVFLERGIQYLFGENAFKTTSPHFQ